MPEPLFTEARIGRIVSAMQAERSKHMARLKVRRALIELVEEISGANGTGTLVVDPFNKSALILKMLIGDPVQQVQRYAARIAANHPQVTVVPPSLSSKPLTKGAEESAAAQERLHMAQWNAAGGSRAQYQIAWSQAWGRVGYYLTLPRDATWGLPDREYYDDLTDDEIDLLIAEGKVSPVKPQGHKAMEAGGSWIARRRDAVYERFTSGTSLNALEALAPDTVYPRWDSEGLKYLTIITEIPAEDCSPGGDMAMAAAKMDGMEGAEAGRYGLYLDHEGRVQGGVNKGGEPGSVQGTALNLIRFLTRSEVYYLIAGPGGATRGKIVYWAEHGDGCVPCVEVPFARTDSMRPGAEHTSPLEGVFALTPVINQIETLLSNVAVTNALPRWVIETTDGNLVRDEETGDPLIIASEPAVGLNPADAQPVAGTVKQLVIDADMLLQLLQFYAERLDLAKLPDVAVGAAGESSTAWGIRQQIAQVQIDLAPGVNNHADAVSQIMKIWIKRERKLDMPLFAFAAPGSRKDETGRRGLIEVDPADLFESIEVRQDSNTPSDRIVLQQAGIELLREAQVIDERQYFEQYALEADPDEAVKRMDISRLRALVLYGDTSQVQPGSVLWMVAQGVQGRVHYELMKRSPAYAIAQAEQMAMQTALGGMQQGMGESAGNPAGAAGLRQPGVGMGLTMPGSPEMGAPPMLPQPASVQ